jgi:tellurite resistance protein TerC
MAVGADWAVFWCVIVIAFAADAVLAHRGGRAPSVRSAAGWSALWIGLALAFGAGIAWRFGADAGLTYLTAYALEKSLSVDNLFLFILVFSQTGIPPALQHRALFWGVLGALVMRAVLIGVGVLLLERFHWLIYPFAAFLVFAAGRMLWGEEKETKLVEATCALCTSWIGRVIPITPVLHGSRFVVRTGGRRMATPLLVALVAIESADLVFALDSIPAVFAVTRDPYLVYTSNVFALFGLRSLYFVLSGAVQQLRFLRPGLAVMLLFVAAKMLLAGVVEVPPGLSLAIIACIITSAVVASKLWPARDSPEAASSPDLPTPAPSSNPAPANAAMPNTACTHADRVRDVEPSSSGCEECLRLGERWVHLRMCLSCGHVGCCDSSKNKHASAHFRATGHPVMRSIEAGENWRWCFVDQVVLEAPDGSR